MEFLLPAQRVGVLRDILMRSPLGGRPICSFCARAFSAHDRAPSIVGLESGVRVGVETGSGSSAQQKIKFERSAPRVRRYLHLDGKIERENRHAPTVIYRRRLEVSAMRQPVDRCRFLRYLFIPRNQLHLNSQTAHIWPPFFAQAPVRHRPRPPLPSSVEKIQFCQPRAGSMCV